MHDPVVELRELLRTYELPEDALDGRTRSTLLLEPDPNGGCRLGGAPDLPEGHAWPREDDVLLTFYAQIDLEGIDAPPLPKQGVLQFFWDERYSGRDDEARWCRILHHTDTAALRRREPPDELASLRGVQHDLGWSRDAVYPERRVGVRRHVSIDARVLDEYTDDRHLWEAMLDLLDAVNGGHRLVGHPHAMQGPVEDEAAEYLAQPTPVLQLDWHDPFEGASAFGDGGRLFFLCEGGDIARAVAIMQCM